MSTGKRKACTRCSYAAICVPMGSENFFARANEAMGFHNGMETEASILNDAVKGLTAFYLSLPRECPDHPAKEHVRRVIERLQDM